jgi:hypothetical protein
MATEQGDVWRSPVVVELDPRFHSGKADTEDKSSLEWRIRGTGPPDILASCELAGCPYGAEMLKELEG